jgi:hypothetical protein
MLVRSRPILIVIKIIVGTLVNVWSTRERRVDGNGIRWMTTKDVEFWRKTAPVQSLVP